MTEYTIYVPADAQKMTAIGPVRGSAIVGGPPRDGKVVIYYEGNLYDAVNLRTFEERVRQAASRKHHLAPTSAILLIDEGDLVAVGVHNYELNRNRIDNKAALDAWLGTEPAQ
jgi:translation initiation factor IF-1